MVSSASLHDQSWNEISPRSAVVALSQHTKNAISTPINGVSGTRRDLIDPGARASLSEGKLAILPQSCVPKQFQSR